MLKEEILNIISGKSEVSVDFREEAINSLGKESFSDGQASDSLLAPIEVDRISESWLPGSVIYHEQEFIDWIKVFLDEGFLKACQEGICERFDNYCQAAEDWLSRDLRYENFSHDPQLAQDFFDSEAHKISVNSLYFLNKYWYLREGSKSGGVMKYRAHPAHKVICFLVDCGYSFFLGKGRQIGATSCLGGIVMSKLLFRRNFTGKLISADEESSLDIADKKLKHGYKHLPAWMRVGFANNSEKAIRVGQKSGDVVRGPNSTMNFRPPSKYEVNSGSPDIVWVDEVGLIRMLTEMLNEAKPASFMYDPETNQILPKRQIIGIGTGGTVDESDLSVGRAYEQEFSAAVTSMFNSVPNEEGLLEVQMLPVYFDFWARPGMTSDFYNHQKRFYESKQGSKEGLSKVQFFQHYPRPGKWRDMFSDTTEGILSKQEIESNLNRIDKIHSNTKILRGYFEPVFDKSKSFSDRMIYNHPIMGVKFVEVDIPKELGKLSAMGDGGMDTGIYAPITMVVPPDTSWRNRYWKGTDPIASVSGPSNFASYVWDSYLNAPVAAVSTRGKGGNIDDAFAQSLMLAIYYGADKGALYELVEREMSYAYVKFIETYSSSGEGFLTRASELMPQMKGGSAGFDIGVDMKGNRKDVVVSYIIDTFTHYADRILLPRPFHQLLNFKPKATRTGKIKYESINKTRYPDDDLDALGLSRILAASNADRIAYELGGHQDPNTRIAARKRKRKVVRNGQVVYENPPPAKNKSRWRGIAQ